jgi:hypothetical protein
VFFFLVRNMLLSTVTISCRFNFLKNDSFHDVYSITDPPSSLVSHKAWPKWYF